MKKTYQKPEVTVTTVVKTDIICVSGGVENGFSLVDDVTETNATSGNLSKDRGEDFGDLW